MGKQENILNVSKHFKRYKALKQLENYNESVEISPVEIVRDVGLFLICLFLIYYCIYGLDNWWSLSVGSIVGLFCIGFFIIRIYKYINATSGRYRNVSNIQMYNDNTSNDSTWNLKFLTRRKSVIIGRNKKNAKVDIDLSRCEHSLLVNYNHAELKHSGGIWYIIDNGSKCKTYLKIIKEDEKIEIEKNRPYRLGVGDVLYIAGKIKLKVC